MEMTNPTGSFKDRGASSLISVLKHQSVEKVHDDSSGNAGAALAAYAARAGIHSKLFVPAYASGPKLNQIRAYGAKLIPVDGARSAATEEAIKTNSIESIYASHALSPFSINSYRSTAFEIWEQLHKVVPDAVLMPLGQGSQLIGIARGFKDILDSGWSTKVPRLYGAQSKECAPLHSLLNLREMEPRKNGETIAEGIRITDPVRASKVVEVIRSSGGDIVTVADNEIRTGMIALARQGIFVEPTSAVVWPLYLSIRAHLPPDSVVVMIVTGSGNKSDLWSHLVLQSEPFGLSERIVE
jgi:threonine synthase